MRHRRNADGDVEPYLVDGLTKKEFFAAVALHAHIVANLLQGTPQALEASKLAKGSLVAANALILALGITTEPVSFDVDMFNKIKDAVKKPTS